MDRTRDEKLYKLAQALPKDELIEILLAARSIDDGGVVELLLFFYNLGDRDRARMLEAARDLYKAQTKN